MMEMRVSQQDLPNESGLDINRSELRIETGFPEISCRMPSLPQVGDEFTCCCSRFFLGAVLQHVRFLKVDVINSRCFCVVV